MDRLKEKVIIVTGGNGLIGRHIVQRLLEESAICYCVDIVPPSEKLPYFIQADITDPASVDNLVATVLERHQRIDGWVNNAYPRTKDWGIPFEDIPLDSWKKNVDMQLNMLFYCSQKVLEVMKMAQGGSLVNIASIYGVVGNDFTVYENTGGMTSPAAYAAIKGGVVNFTRYLASYYGRYNLRVNTVSPGGVFDYQNETFKKNFESKVPLRRMAKPQEIAPGVAFLLSDDASYISGHNLMIDGGWTAI